MAVTIYLESWLKIISIISALLFMQSVGFSQLTYKPYKVNRTFSYKKVDKMRINADFYPAEERLSLYFYTRQKGIWPLLVTGHNPKKEQDWFKEYCPIQNIDAKYPSVLLIHGDKDTDVPINESIRLKDKLKSVGIKNSYVQMRNYGHVFDLFDGGLSNPEIGDVFNSVLTFFNQHK